MARDSEITEIDQAPDEGSDGSERRRFIRATTVLSARLLTRRGAFEGTVLDASLNGVKVWTAGDVPVGSAVTLVLAGAVHFGGTVVWRRGETLGICFHDDPEKVASIMAALLPQRCLQVGHA
ncbi:PilZ domain-containing protein [Pelagibius sp.]|uniref:PilZ domain-containing protein n=1 Tax=Pelagibius sp. TaxID=1931238 RepID=UPI002608DE30|nr:PilZ domain-containing protein [Pelagibius sp.]